MSAPDQLLVVIDPVARRCDGESVRIAKDVLCGGAAAKVCLPATPQEFARALARRGGRRPVVVGDDRALVHAVRLLHRDGELDGEPLALVPVGPDDTVRLAAALGAPLGAVTAARAVLDGVERRLDLLVDEHGGVVVGGLRIPDGTAAAVPDAPEDPTHTVWGTARTLVRTLVGPQQAAAPRVPQMRGHRLRVEADGRVVCDVEDPVEGVAVTAEDGVAVVEVHPRAGAPVRHTARAVRVSAAPGADFRYHADGQVRGPLETRTWTLHAASWSLLVPSPALAPEAP
ncbi:MULTISPECIES: diacylglycerol kinase [unclassified Streptomyces]|uniref:diacylglycerol kinase n=1 Tax=unclassified Streptomyces TaxID=2593676 RepID=UPI0008DD6F27|nr:MULTISPECIES: diacylglycerol kinase [unclassified Streptomyces]OII67060.1 diacylglycerol kinase [Streptomyces sp. CC77]